MSVYTTKLADQICERTAHSSIGLRHICSELGVAYSTVTNWIYDEDHELHAKYAKAKLMQLHHLADEVLEIADDSTNDYMTVVKNGKSKQVLNREAISRSNLRIRARLMLIAKLSPILHDSKIKPKEKPPLKIGFKIIEMPENEYGSSSKSQYEQPGASTVQEDQTSQLTDADTKDMRTEAQEKMESPYRSSLSSSRTNIPGSSPKNTLKPAPTERDEIVPGFAEFVSRGGAPALYRR